eukprot:gene21483-41548_t
MDYCQTDSPDWRVASLLQPGATGAQINPGPALSLDETSGRCQGTSLEMMPSKVAISSHWPDPVTSATGRGCVETRWSK